MYARYKKQRTKGKDHFECVEEVCLFGCKEGYIPWLLSKQQISASQGEPYKWHVAVGPELANTEIPRLQSGNRPKAEGRRTRNCLSMNCSMYGDIRIMTGLRLCFGDVSRRRRLGQVRSQEADGKAWYLYPGD